MKLFTLLMLLNFSASAAPFYEVTESDFYPTLSVKIPGLTDDLFAEYVLVKTEAPAWENAATDYMYDTLTVTEDSQQIELVHVMEHCNENGDLADDVVFYNDLEEFTWEAVKPVGKETTEALLYVVQHFTVIYLEDTSATCKIPQDKYVFDTKLQKDGTPTYLGILQENQ